jgi:F-type H+-transporting ATPase subunit c
MAVEELKTISDLAQLGAGIAIGFGAIGAGLGIGFATKGLMEAISRQPEIAGKAIGFFLVGAALAEACAIYALIIALKLSGMIG